MDLQDQLRTAVKKLLEDGAVELVIGHQQGTDPYRLRPLFAETLADADKLVLSPLSAPGIVRYHNDADRKTALVVSGCDARLVQVLVRESQLQRDQVHLIGVPCEGQVDVAKLAAHPDVDLRTLTGVTIDGDEVVVQAEAGEVRLPKIDVLRVECRACDAPTLVACDTALGEQAAAPGDGEDTEVAELDAMTPAERLELFSRAFERCMRCYACVHACPLCYCEVCFAEQTDPQWIRRTTELPENMAFHLGRAMHMAGRCVQCGACDRACPMDVPLRELYAKMAAEIRELFGEEALDPDKDALFLTFQPEDTEEAIDGSVTH
jgi:ferredoxin